MLNNILNREEDIEAVIEEGSLENEVDQGVEGMPDEQNACSCASSGRQKLEGRDVGYDEQ